MLRKIAEKSFTNLTPGEHEFTFDLNDNGVTDAAKFLYARIGVKAREGNDYIFSGGHSTEIDYFH